METFKGEDYYQDVDMHLPPTEETVLLNRDRELDSIRNALNERSEQPVEVPEKRQPFSLLQFTYLVASFALGIMSLSLVYASYQKDLLVFALIWGGFFVLLVVASHPGVVRRFSCLTRLVLSFVLFVGLFKYTVDALRSARKPVTSVSIVKLESLRSEERYEDLLDAAKGFDGDSGQVAGLVNSASSALKEQEIKAAIEQTEKFMADKQFFKAWNLAKDFTEIEKLSKLAKTARKKYLSSREDVLIRKAKTIPFREYRKNFEIYQELARLRPDNATYAKKMERYRKLLEKKK